MKRILHSVKKYFLSSRLACECSCSRQRSCCHWFSNELSDNRLEWKGIHSIPTRAFGTSWNLSRNEGSEVKDRPTSIDSFGAWDNNFELPILMDASIQYGAPIPRISALDVGRSSINGRRDYQEDRFFIKDYSEDLLCCAVFDGHGGSDCAEFCVTHLENLLKEKLTHDCDLETFIHGTILQLNSDYNSWSLTNNKGDKSGSTCTICLLRGGVELVVGHVGDSRALISRQGAPRRITYDHCPSNVSERV